MISRMGRVGKYASQYWYSQLSNAMNAVYGIANPRLRSALTVPLYKMIQMHHLLTMNKEGRIFRVHGISAQTGQPLKAAFVGSWSIGQHNTLLFYRHLLFEDGSAKMEDCGSFTMTTLRQQAEKCASQADLVLVQTNSLLAWQPASGDWAAGPVGIRMTFNYLPGETWEMVSHRIGFQSGNLRRVRSSGFSYRISHEDADFTDFYHAMHIPMVKSRYRDFGDILNEEGLRYIFKNGGFLMQIVDEDGQVVASGLEYISNRVLFGLLNGVRGGDQQLTKRGALLAIYYFTLKHCAESSIHRIDAGLCPPFTTNGLYQHKRSWRFEPELDYWKPYSMILWAPESSPSAVEWMKANPIVPKFARWGGDGIKEAYESATL